MIHKTIILLSLSLIVFTACKKGGNDPDTGKVLVLTAAEQQKVVADNGFTLKLFKTTLSGSSDEGNLMLSPLSVSIAIGITSNGSSGQTLQDIRNTMNFQAFTEDEVNNYYHKLITELPQLDSKTTLKIANSIWYANSFTPTPAFLQVNTASYNASVQGVDFKNPDTKNLINNWVNNATNGKISKIVDAIPDNEIMYLINAIYFKSNWNSRFDAANTKPSTFYLRAGNTVSTDFMNAGSMAINVVNTNDATAIELPYINKKFSMVILQPIKGKLVKDYAASLDSAKWDSLINKLSPEQASVSLPKFKFSYEIRLNDILSGLGMASAFSGAADFTRINAAGNLSITEIKHKTYINVDETGTEAAAVTSVSIGLTSVLSHTYKIDRPFIFAIREMKSGLILFTGVVNDPTK